MNFSLKKLYFIYFLLALSCSSSNDEPTNERAIAPQKSMDTQTPLGEHFVLETTKSILLWKGKNALITHEGSIALHRGDIYLKTNGTYTGSFEFDLKNLKAFTKANSRNISLEKHLKSGDFFDVERYPSAQLQILLDSIIDTNEHYMIVKLNLHGIDHNIETRINVSEQKDTLLFKTHLIINRHNWGITYGSELSLGDKLINKNVEVGLTAYFVKFQNNDN
jgi:polyisoprenoid-binding protein YceI